MWHQTLSKLGLLAGKPNDVIHGPGVSAPRSDTKSQGSLSVRVAR